MRVAERIHTDLPLLRLVNRRTEEYVGSCPFCGGDASSDRFHVRMAESGGRPARRFWCRSCGEKGLLDRRFGDDLDDAAQARAAEAAQRAAERRVTQGRAAGPQAAHIAYYRQIYTLVVLWAHSWLFDEANPDPLRYIAERGLSADDARRQLLGYGLHDPQALVAYFTEAAPELLPYAEEVGILVRDQNGTLRTHWNLCGALVFPSIVDSEVTDLRMRRIGTGHKTKSLPGSLEDRGATFPMGWDTLEGPTPSCSPRAASLRRLSPRPPTTRAH